MKAENTPRPVVPDASPEAKALLNFIYSINGEKVLSGQQGLDEADYVKGVTGVYPAIKGHDLIRESENQKVVNSIIDWWNRGGIPTLMWHWGAPGKGEGYENSKKEIDIDRCFQEGTAEYEAMWADLRRVADWLTVLRDANVPVIWRPMHECDGDWFWYGKGTGEQFCRVWRTMFDYFTKERGLNNLIWVLCHCGQPRPEFDPGETYYDIVGADSYNKERIRQEMYNNVIAIHGSSRPVTYHECGTIPDPDLCKDAGVDWIWWMLWSREYLYNYDKDDLKRIYSHDRVLTMDELPDIMSYLPDVPNVYDTPLNGAFPLVSADGQAAGFYIDGNDHQVVSITSTMLSEDVERVTGIKPQLASIKKLSDMAGGPAVVAGTLGSSRLIDKLAKDGLIKVDDIRSKWESFIITTIRHPDYKTPLLVVAGSDRRGTAFGLTTLCKAVGVSPWYFWADVTPAHRAALYVEPGRFKQGEPSVQYRGIFINDERFGGWARWVENTFDKESGKVGPKVYTQVFELLLRLKGNYLWPAMHPGTQAFNDDPENARLADAYAIVMGSSHCEQMLRNNEGEWKAVNEKAVKEGRKAPLGDFNYITNRKTMQNYWETRVKTNGKYENTYTLGLRGIHDYPMEGANTTEERVKLMQQALDDQRDILRRNIRKPVEEIPQVLCTYEEVLDAYHNGLKVPDDVTLLWSDDKHGYTRNLSNPEERKRSGGAGIYYHISYHGDPASWIWLSPLSPAFISTELTKAYTFGAQKIWVFNVGDIKPAEKEISFAMDLAWDIDKWNPGNAHGYIRRWASSVFGPEFAKDIADIQDGYYRLQASGKDSHVYFVNYSEEETDRRLDEYKDLAFRAMTLQKHLPQEFQDAYFELVLYPVKGAYLLNRYQLLSRRSMARGSAGKDDAVKDGLLAKQAYMELDEWTRRYNEDIKNGKWLNFFDWHPYHWTGSTSMDAPIFTQDDLDNIAKLPAARFLDVAQALSRDGVEIISEAEGELPVWMEALTPVVNFSKAPENNVFCKVVTSDGSYEASATPINNIWHAPYVGPMWSKVGTIHLNKGLNFLKVESLKADARLDRIFIGLYPPFPPAPSRIIPARDYTAKHDSPQNRIRIVEQLGFSNGVMVQPFDTPSYEISDLSKVPSIEYEIELQEGTHTIEIRTLPTLHVYEGRDARYAVQFAGDKPQIYSIHTGDFTAEWRWNVLRGYSTRKLDVTVEKSGTQKLRFFFLDPGIVLQEIRID